MTADHTIQRSIRVNGVLTDATSVKFSDPTGSFGVRRQDTGEVIVPDGTDLVRISTGLYSYAIPGEDLVAGKVYEYWIERELGGVTTRTERLFTAGLAKASGSYTDQTRMLLYAGRANLVAHCDVEGNKNDDDVAEGCQSGIDHVESRINIRLVEYGFTAIPWPAPDSLDPSNASSAGQKRIAAWKELQNLATIGAIAKSYWKRGRLDNTDENAPVFGTYGVMTGLWKEFERQFENWLRICGPLYGSGSAAVEPGTLVSVPLRWGQKVLCDENGCG